MTRDKGREEARDEIEGIRGQKPHEKNRFISQLVRMTLEQRGSFCRVDNGTRYPDLYYFDEQTRRAYTFCHDANRTDPACLLILKREFSIAPRDSEMLPLLADLVVEASTSGDLVVPRRLWHWAGRYLYLNFHSDRVYRIGPEGKRKVVLSLSSADTWDAAHQEAMHERALHSVPQAPNRFSHLTLRRSRRS